MPRQYDSIRAEHHAVREAAGLFDVSHMGNLRIEGPDAGALLGRATVSRPDKLKEERGVYTVMLDERANILDDTIVYRIEGDSFYMVPNAGKNESIAAHLRGIAAGQGLDVEVTDVSRETAILALQGPRAPQVLQHAGARVDPEPRFRLHTREIAGQVVWVATTGYTGETGYELFVDARSGTEVYERLRLAGEDLGLRPVGLGARDTLRLEMGYALAGNEFAGGRSPLEAGLGWIVKWDHEFVGKETLVAQREAATHDRLVGLRMEGRAVPRHDYPVLVAGKRVGTVTSGTMSPSLGVGIALAYVRPEHAEAERFVDVAVRGEPHPARVVRPPFLARGGA
jgi:aminomethyltransferase